MSIQNGDSNQNPIGKLKISWHKLNPERSRTYQKDYYKAHKEHKMAYQRAYQRKNKYILNEKKKIYKAKLGISTLHRKYAYGITQEQYETQLEAQGFRCAICAADNPRRKNSKQFCVDHDHNTRQIRGLLCNPCNTTLAIVENTRFKNVAEMYLDYWKAQLSKRS